MITPDIASFAQSALHELHTRSRQPLANSETVADRALGLPGTLHGITAQCHIPLTIVEPMRTRLFAKIFIASLSVLAVAAIAFAFTSPSGAPDLTFRIAQRYFGVALQIFCFLVVTFWIVDLVQRDRDHTKKDV
jgi:hypothetical protein